MDCLSVSSEALAQKMSESRFYARVTIGLRGLIVIGTELDMALQNLSKAADSASKMHADEQYDGACAYNLPSSL